MSLSFEEHQVFGIVGLPYMK